MENHDETDQMAFKKLTELEIELTNRLENLSADMSQSHSKDSSEQAVERENDEVVTQLERETVEELQKIKLAKQRIQQGVYHVCTKCGGEISAGRLLSIPYTTLCINCAD
jgi:RNA polymerase-binding transcription factor DksA